MRTMSAVYYVVTDRLGSTSLTTNDSGALYAELRFRPYGEVRYSYQTMPTDRRYTGQHWVEGIGLYDYRARWYDPALARFVSPDIIVPDPANPQSLNHYSYVYNRPLVYLDDDGNFPWLVIPILAVTAVLCARANMDPVLVSETRYLESLHTTSATDLDALTTMFTTDRLRGETAEERFGTILGHTRKVPGLYTAGGWGETGLNIEFQDGRWYAQYWGGETAQIGHFLTAAAFGHKAALGLDDQKGFLKLAVGHEMVRDPLWLMQYMAATPQARDLFNKAVESDIAGNYGGRDEYLATILMMNGGALEGRKGNSLEDLRLTVRGWRFGQMLAGGRFRSREEAAQWLNDNLG